MSKSNPEGVFPKYRIYWYLLPGILLFLFLPFRFVQWVSILAILFLLVSYATSYLLYRGIKVTVLAPVTYGYRDQDVTTRFIIHNAARFAAVNLGISVFTPSQIPGQQKVLGLLSVAGRSQSVFDVTIRMSGRGEFSLAPIVLEGSDPFSIFPWRIVVRDIARLVIYPHIHHGRFIPKRGIPGGSIRVFDKMYDDVNSIGSIRDYIPGDDIRRIHWKASAKSGELRTAQLLPSMNAPAMVLLDLDSSAYPRKYRYLFIERAVEVAASIVHLFGSMNQQIGLVSNGFDAKSHPIIPPKSVSHSASLALRILARITPSTDAIDPISLFLDARFSTQPGLGCFIISGRSPVELASQLTHPTFAALKPRYIHIAEKRQPSTEGLSIDYLFIDEPQELFNGAT